MSFSVYENWRWTPKWLYVDVVYEEVRDLNVSFAEPLRAFQVSEPQAALLPGWPVGVSAVVTSSGACEFPVHAWFADQPGVILTEFYELAPENIDSTAG